MKSPVFSVVVPAYNRASMLVGSISSILAQTFTDLELLIIDDGSVDNTKEVISDFALKDARVHYYWQTNAERAAARNHGFRRAKGIFVMFFDSDDLMPPDALANMHRVINENPQYNLYAGKYVFNSEGQIRQSVIATYKAGAYGLDLVLRGNTIGTLFTVRKGAFPFLPFPEDRRFAVMEDWMCLMYNLIKQPLYLGDFIGCVVNDHDSRSMSNNKAVIHKRLLATDVLGRELPLMQSQLREMWAYSYYFCAVHAYLDEDRANAINYIWNAISRSGPKKIFLMAGLKAIIGRNTIKRFKSI